MVGIYINKAEKKNTIIQTLFQYMDWSKLDKKKQKLRLKKIGDQR